jgi:hypothetical protein
MARRLALIAALGCVVALVGAASASASRGARFGIQDDAWLLHGPGTLDSRVSTLDRLGVKLVRVTLRWYQVAPNRPAAARDPNDPAYDWSGYSTALDALHADGITVLLTLWGSPRWANGDRRPAWLPSAGFGDFAYAASKEFPWVHLWTAWNEPNTRATALPVSPRLYTQRVLDPAWAGLHQANGANRVAGGVTSPRATAGGMSPLAFMEGMARAHARLDAYAHNPYPGSSRETPFRDPCTYCRTLTMARLPLVRADVTRYFGPKPIWLTEYGYQTNPPDRLFGVSPTLQARYLGEAGLRTWEEPGVTMLINFLVRDEPELGGWQSGFFAANGSVKPSYRAFGLPLAEVSRSGWRVVLWGQVRPGSGRRPYVLQRRAGSRWVAIGGTRRTDASGSFEVTIRARPGEQLRTTSPVVAYASPALPVA